MRFWAALALLGLILMAPCRAQEAEQLDRLQRLGEQQPAQALVELQALPKTGSRHQQWLEGWLLIQAGRMQEALRLQSGLAPTDPARLLLNALVERRSDRSQRADDLARQAVEGLANCRDCGPQLAFEAHWLRSHTHNSLGEWAAAEREQRKALMLAEQMGDVHRQARSLAHLAQWLQTNGKGPEAKATLDKALALPGLEPFSEVYVQLGLATVARQNRNPEARRIALERALALAEPGTRLANAARLHLSDHWLHNQQAQQARDLAEAALATAQTLQDLGQMRTARHNLAISLIQLGDSSQARQVSAQLAAQIERSGAEVPPSEQLEMLDEQAKAWAQAAQWPDALRALRAEQELAAAFAKQQLETALNDQRQNQETSRHSAELALLQDQQSTHHTQAENQRILRWLGVLAAVFLALGLAIGCLLWASSRAAQRRLQGSRAQLQDLAEHDALTGLCNRRGLLNRMSKLGNAHSAQGGWMLIDIDHFKRVNDDLGHAAGDQVLKAVASRLAAQVRDSDLLARWGGEEFLLHAPDASSMALRQLAQRMLQRLNKDPIRLDDGSHIAITASIGFLALPLPKMLKPFDWERAVSWADMALYTAKNAGRNRAIGVLGAKLEDERSLDQIEADFEGAALAARVQLVQLQA